MYLTLRINKGATLPHPSIVGKMCTEDEVIIVPNTDFWRRRIKEGSADKIIDVSNKEIKSKISKNSTKSIKEK